MIGAFLEDKSHGKEHSAEDIRAFIEGVVGERWTRAQIGAWLAFVFAHGMSAEETVALTAAMAASGDRLQWPTAGGEVVDKHSTGGIGDKVSLVLAPLWASLGKRVPMLSGRGLGITGGTLDKLEAIPGYDCQLSLPRLGEVLAEVGCFINGQTATLAPADRILYALRDETGTVASVPLITASILSKKLVEGLERLVMDVKFGSGAFMKRRAEAELLADSLATVGRGAGLQMEVHLTPMSTPLGCAIGNALEVEEAIACLRGHGPADLEALVVKLSGEGEQARAALHDGRALARWEAMVAGHGGDLSQPLRGGGVAVAPWISPASGVVQTADAGALGRAAFLLGAGRQRADQPIHHGVGLLLLKKPGEAIAAGEPLLEIHHADGHGLEAARAEVETAFRIE